MTALSISISVMSLVYTILSACECYVYILIYLFGIKMFNLIHFKNVTDFWKTNQIVTLGLFHLLAMQANSHSHALPIYRAITRFGWLVCFSRASFTDHVISLLGKQDPWRTLHGTMGLKFSPVVVRCLLGSLEHIWAYSWHFLDW